MIEQITSYTARGDKIKEIIDAVNNLTKEMNALIGDVARMKREMGGKESKWDNPEAINPFMNKKEKEG